MEFIDIHPLDLGAILWGDENPTDIILHRDAPGSQYPSEYVEYRGKFYRQTVNVLVTSEYGKKILKQMEEDNA